MQAGYSHNDTELSDFPLPQFEDFFVTFKRAIKCSIFALVPQPPPAFLGASQQARKLKVQTE